MCVCWIIKFFYTKTFGITKTMPKSSYINSLCNMNLIDNILLFYLNALRTRRGKRSRLSDKQNKDAETICISDINTLPHSESAQKCLLGVD